jgi:glycopeptide antibiotics resistance protein
VTPRRRYLAARAAYVAVVLLATLTDLELSGDLSAALARLARAVDPAVGWRDAVDGLRNVALFAGLGAVWVATSLRGALATDVRQATLTGFALSALVEGLQVFSAVRTASVLDLATNTFGAFAGAWFLGFVLAAVRRTKGTRSYLGIPSFLPAGAYGLAVLTEAATPLFRNNQMPWVPGGPLAWMREALAYATPLSWGQVPLADVLLVAPAGFLVVMALAENGLTTALAWRLTAGVGAALLFAAELAHGVIRLPIRYEAATTHAVALGVGSWAAHRLLAPMTRGLRGPTRSLGALLAYAAVLLLWGLRPYVPVTSFSGLAAQFTAARLVPLQALAERADVFSAAHVAQQFLLYVPLGALLAVWPLRLTGRWSHLWPALWLVAAVEVGHLVTVDRTFDVTNGLIAVAGLGIGWVLVRHAGFQPYGASARGWGG